MSFEEDLLNLCQLNQLAEHIDKRPHVDRDITMVVIERKRQELADRLTRAAMHNENQENDGHAKGEQG